MAILVHLSRYRIQDKQTASTVTGAVEVTHSAALSLETIYVVPAQMMKVSYAYLEREFTKLRQKHIPMMN